MMRMLTRTRSVATSLALVISVVSCDRSAAPGAAASVKVAANLPETGPLAVYGESIREGAQFAIEDLVSDTSRVTPKILVDWQDNRSDAATAVTVWQRQRLSSPDVYVSGVKPQTMAIRADVARDGLAHFVWIFDRSINQGTSNAFRTWVSYKIEPELYRAFIARVKPRRLAVVFVRLPHTIEEFEQDIVPSLRALGVDSAHVESFELGKEDFRDVATRFAQFKPDAIVLNGFQGDLVRLVRALRSRRLITDGNTIATYDMLDAARVLGPAETEGIRVVAPEFETLRAGGGMAGWRDRFKGRFGKEPLYTHAFAYDMINAIARASDSVPRPASRDNWRRALMQVDFQGITGRVRFDADGDLLTPLRIGVYRHGVLVPDSAR